MLKVGIVGLGAISELHLKNYYNHPQVELIALCDQNETRLQEIGKKYNIKYLYTSYEEFLTNEQFNAISICTWNNFHASMSIQALRAGKHVLVEKPLSVTVEEAIAVQNEAEKKGNILQIGNVRRYSSNVQLVKQLIEQGELGDIYYSKASCLRRAGNPGGWFSDKNLSGGGPLIDLGVHMIDMIWYLMGRPKPITISGNTYEKLGNRSNIKNLSSYHASDYQANVNNVEDVANALIRFENGASMYVDASFTLHAKKDEVTAKLYGEKGGAELEPELSIVTEKNNTILNITPQVDTLTFDVESAFTHQIDHFVRSCIEDKPVISSVEDGVIMMKILTGIYKSAKLNREIML